MGEYAVPMTPKGWFRSARFGEDKPINQPSSMMRIGPSPRRNKKRLIVSQSMVIDIDPNKVLISPLSSNQY